MNKLEHLSDIDNINGNTPTRLPATPGFIAELLLAYPVRAKGSGLLLEDLWIASGNNPHRVLVAWLKIAIERYEQRTNKS